MAYAGLRLFGMAAVMGTALATAGCANPRADDAVRAQSALVGLSRDQLLSCAGVPVRQLQSGGTEYFTYQSESVYGAPVSTGVGIFGGSSGRIGTGVGLGFPLGGGGYNEIRRSTCEATFTLRDGRVQDLNYTDPQGGSGRGQCYQIVENCLRIAPAGLGTGGSVNPTQPNFPPLPQPAPLPLPNPPSTPQPTPLGPPRS